MLDVLVSIHAWMVSLTAAPRSLRRCDLNFCKRVDPMYWCVALLVLLTTNASQAKAEPPDEWALRLVNHYRQLAGLTPVELDQQLSAGCMEHANYMVQNRGTDAMAGLNAHTQRPSLPGASAAGAACAKAADLFPRGLPLNLRIVKAQGRACATKPGASRPTSPRLSRRSPYYSYKYSYKVKSTVPALSTTIVRLGS